MLIRVIVLIISISAFTAAYAQKPTDEQLDRFFTLKGAPRSYDSAMASIYMPLAAMMDGGNFKVKNKDKAVRVADKVIAEFKWENVKPAVYKFYRSNYTFEEIEAYIKLLSRPEFRVMIAKENALAEEYDKVLQSITFQNMLNIILQVELEKKKSK